MYRHSFRHRVVTGTFSFPLMALITGIFWIIPGLTDHDLWAGLISSAAITFLLTELSNRHSLLRIRSRMVSITYLLLMLINPALHYGILHLIPSLCLVLCYFTLYSSYQKIRPEGYIYHTFFFAGIGSLFYTPMLWLALGFYISIIFQLRNISWTSFVAGILGFITPYWIWAAYALWTQGPQQFFSDVAGRFSIPDIEWTAIGLPQYLSLGTITFLALLAFIHYFRTSYNDKIRTRMLYYIIATQQLILWALIFVYPTLFKEQFSLLILNSSILLAHYYSLAKGRYFRYWFNISVMLLAALGVYNYLTLH